MPEIMSMNVGEHEGGQGALGMTWSALCDKCSSWILAVLAASALFCQLSGQTHETLRYWNLHAQCDYMLLLGLPGFSTPRQS